MKKKFSKATAACVAGMTAALLAGSVVPASDSAVESVVESVAESAVESAAEAAMSGAEAVQTRPEYRALDYTTLGEYTGLTVEVSPVSISDVQVESQIYTNIRTSDKGSETFTEGTVEEGDVANIDFEGKKDGVAFEGGTAQGYELEIGSGTFIEGFEEGLIGATVGETVDLNLTFPEEYGSEELAGQDVVFTVTVNSVKRFKELDDALAEALSDGEAKTVDEYRQVVKDQLEGEAIENRNQQAKQELLQMASDNCTINEYPQDLTDYMTNEVTEYFKSYAAMYGMDFNTFLSAALGTTEEEFPEKAVEMAKDSIRQEFCVNAIAEQESLLPEGEELAKEYDDLAVKNGFANGEELLAQYGEYTVNYTIAVQKVTDFLFDHAVVVEKAPETDSSVESVAEEVLGAESLAESAAESVAEAVAE